MSQRPPASRPASRSPPDPQRITLPPVQLRDDTQQRGRQAGRQQPDLEGRRALQQLQTSPQHPRAGRTTPSGEEWRSSGPSRDLGVHSILNPTEQEGGSRSSSRHLSAAPSESPSSEIGRTSQFGESLLMATPNTFPGPQALGASPNTEGYGGVLPRVRKILTPRSPSRVISSARGSQGKIDAQLSPFLHSRGRSYMVEPGPFASSEVPPMPTPPAQTQQQYGFPTAASTPTADRRTSGGTMQAPGHAPLSRSGSPSMSASSMNPSSSQTSPASFPYSKGGQAPPPTTTPYFPGSSFGPPVQQGGMQFRGAYTVPEGPYIAQAPPQAQGGSSLHSSSAGSSRQTSASDPIQVLTITTSQGQYTVPVDVHQASRLADEKRARNSGASARFRQRRKEKEKEASVNIDKLNQQTRELERKIREVEQERDFYRAERDRFRDVLFRNPEMRHLVTQAPPSPPTMRTGGSFQGSISQVGGSRGPVVSPVGCHPADSAQDRDSRRRKMDARGNFSTVPPSLPPTSTPQPPQPTGYAPPPGPGQSLPSLPPLRIDNTAAPQAAPPNMPPATASGPLPPYDPYSRGPYERGWPSEGGRR